VSWSFGKPTEVLANHRLPLGPRREDLLQTRASVAIAGNGRRVRHLVVGQAERMPRRRVAESSPADPRIGGEHEMPQRLDERPLLVDTLVQPLSRQCPGPIDSPRPQPLESSPRFPITVGIHRPHLGPLGLSTIELGPHQRYDVDAVDPQVLDLGVDLDVHQRGTADRDAAQVDQLEPRTGQVDIVEARSGQVDVLEPGAGQVLLDEFGHPLTLPQRFSNSPPLMPPREP
jgi:hypothetical protein